MKFFNRTYISPLGEDEKLVTGEKYIITWEESGKARFSWTHNRLVVKFTRETKTLLVFEIVSDIMGSMSGELKIKKRLEPQIYHYLPNKPLLGFYGRATRDNFVKLTRLSEFLDRHIAFYQGCHYGDRNFLSSQSLRDIHSAMLDELKRLEGRIKETEEAEKLSGASFFNMKDCDILEGCRDLKKQ